MKKNKITVLEESKVDIIEDRISNKLELNGIEVMALSVTQYAKNESVSVQWVREMCKRPIFKDGSVPMQLGQGPHVIFVPIEKKIK